MDLPKMVRIRQRLYDRALVDLDSVVIRQVERRLQGRVQPGQRIAIATGSRGIANIARIVRGVVEGVRRVGGDPFVFPAMGSHGGGTAEGQLEVLASLGVTEAFVRCPILSSMDVVQIGSTDDGLPVYLDRNAASADGIIVVNRIKKHTDFHGEVESGLMKMLCIGVGKRAQADLVHSYGSPGLKRYIPMVARVTLARAPILLGVATVENGYDETAEIATFDATELEAGEKRMLRKHRRTYPAIPVDDFDVLIVDRLGKDISGTGMDTNVIGRIKIHDVPEPKKPNIHMIIALSLTDGSHGNAVGVGLADLINQQLRDKIDPEAMAVNVITSGFLERGRVPITLPTDRDCFDTAMGRLPSATRPRARIVRILDTLHLGEMDVSESLLPELERNTAITVVGSPQPLAFDETGTIIPMAFEERVPDGQLVGI